MVLKVKLRDLFYGKTMEQIKKNYKRNCKDFKVEDLTEKELKCLAKYEVIQPSKYNKYEPFNDVDFLIEYKRKKNPTAAQEVKKRVLEKTIVQFLSCT